MRLDVGEVERQRQFHPASLPEGADDVRDVGDRLALRDHQRQAPRHHQRAERHDEGRDARLGHHKAGEQAEHRSDQQWQQQSDGDHPPDLIGGCRDGHPAHHYPSGDSGRQADHRADGHVELPCDHDDRHAGRDDQHDRHLAEQVADVDRRQEAVVGDLHDDDEDRQDGQGLDQAVGAPQRSRASGRSFAVCEASVEEASVMPPRSRSLRRPTRAGSSRARSRRPSVRRRSRRGTSRARGRKATPALPAPW